MISNEEIISNPFYRYYARVPKLLLELQPLHTPEYQVTTRVATATTPEYQNYY